MVDALSTITRLTGVNSHMDTEYFLYPIRQFAENILDYRQNLDETCRIPLIGDAIDPQTGKWAKYDVADVRADTALSNPAHQQNLMRLFVGLSRLTGDDRYISS